MLLQTLAPYKFKKNNTKLLLSRDSKVTSPIIYLRYKQIT